MRTMTASSPLEEVSRCGGSKGYNLHRLTAAGFRVPRFAIVGRTVFADFLEDNSIHDELGRLLAAAGDAGEDTHRSAERIAALIDAGRLTGAVREAIVAAYDEVGAPRVAVRSSGVEEDGAEFSFAGQFESFLDVCGPEETAERVRQCWASAFSTRSLHYRLRHGLPLRPTGVAVVVQRMVCAERSGILFTAHPMTGDTGQFVLSAGLGRGDGVVSGAVDTDTVVLDSATGALRTPLLDGGATDGQDSAVAAMLGPQDLAELHALGTRVAALFGRPQDIEWAIADGEVWLLQSRPITTGAGAPQGELAPAPDEDGELRVWDNSNIIESFSGLVSPLTYSFAADAYARVYREYGRALLVAPHQLRQMDEWLPEMLGYFHGRVYYNLLHWYRMVRLAPAYRLTRRVLEVSLGVEEPLPDKIADGLHPFTFRSPLARWVSRAVTLAEFTRRFCTINRSVDRFVAYFYDAYQVFDNVDYDALPGEEVYRRFRSLERTLIARWGPMMVLDATLLLSFGALSLLTRRWLPGAPDWFVWAVANPGAEVESMQPARALTELVALVRADPTLTELVDTRPAEEAYAALGDPRHAEFLAAVEDYLARFGYRSFDELKLEVPDLREEPASLFVMLRAALHEATLSTAADAEEYLDARLRGPRRALFEVVRRKTKVSLANRERLRFCRTRAFGSAKRMLRTIGRDLAREGVIADWQDVFFLRLEEVRGLFGGTVAHAELPALVALRRRQQESDAARRAPSRFTTTGSVYRCANLAGGAWSGGAAGQHDGDELRGWPSAPGVAEGRAVVAEVPTDVRSGILLAYRTDPGWVVALPSASALVIERGSPLTHLAIVARELGIPTVVQVKDATRRIRTGMRLRVDGGTGVVTILDRVVPDDPEPTVAGAGGAS